MVGGVTREVAPVLLWEGVIIIVRLAVA